MMTAVITVATWPRPGSMDIRAATAMVSTKDARKGAKTILSTIARPTGGKRFNPNPRGPYDDKDHGYQRVYGDKNAYKTQYTNGYRAGYQSNFNRGYSGY